MAEINLPPSIRYMIVCDDLLPDEQRPGKLLIVGLVSLVTWPSDSTVSLSLEKLVILLILTDGRGVGMGRILCINEETGKPVFGSAALRISFQGKNPTGHYAVTFKLLDCRFPEPGVYIVRFLYDEVPLHEQLITVR